MSTFLSSSVNGYAFNSIRQQTSAKSMQATVPMRCSRAMRYPKCQAILTTIPRSREPLGSPRRLPVMGLISALVDVQSQVQQLEELAGRTAMIGFIVALSAELLTERSIFKTVDYQQLALYGGAVLTAVILAAAAAAVSNKRRLGLDIKEAVISSMTAAQRSAASVTGKQVDWAVDNVVNKVFDMSVIYSLLADEDLI
eukprot:GHUV01005817.1.p1 GENE.GHUV01005817.1~~GHUV01005817.1.p1  ORF type:complete len:198 (+),score=42.04 GHUV01005817.1:167-760(+)